MKRWEPCVKTIVLSSTCHRRLRVDWNFNLDACYYVHCRSFCLSVSLSLFPLFFLSFQRQTANSFFMPTDCIVAFDYISICADSSFFPPHGFVNSRRTNNCLCPLVSRGIEYYVVAMDKWYLSSFFSLFPQKLLRKKNWIKKQTFIDIYSAKLWVLNLRSRRDWLYNYWLGLYFCLYVSILTGVTAED